MSQEDVIVKQQDQIEIYINGDDGITIKATNGLHQTVHISFRLEYAERIAERIIDVFRSYEA